MGAYNLPPELTANPEYLSALDQTFGTAPAPPEQAPLPIAPEPAQMERLPQGFRYNDQGGLERVMGGGTGDGSYEYYAPTTLEEAQSELAAQDTANSQPGGGGGIFGFLDKLKPSNIYEELAKIPGSFEATTTALDRGINDDLSWNPYDPEGASVWDVGAGGTKLSESEDARNAGRLIGTAVGGYFAAPALSGLATSAGVPAGALSNAAAGGVLGAAVPAAGGANRQEIASGAWKGAVSAGLASGLVDYFSTAGIPEGMSQAEYIQFLEANNVSAADIGKLTGYNAPGFTLEDLDAMDAASAAMGGASSAAPTPPEYQALPKNQAPPEYQAPPTDQVTIEAPRLPTETPPPFIQPPYVPPPVEDQVVQVRPQPEPLPSDPEDQRTPPTSVIELPPSPDGGQVFEGTYPKEPVPEDEYKGFAPLPPTPDPVAPLPPNDVGPVDPIDIAELPPELPAKSPDYDWLKGLVKTIGKAGGSSPGINMSATTGALRQPKREPDPLPTMFDPNYRPKTGAFL